MRRFRTVAIAILVSVSIIACANFSWAQAPMFSSTKKESPKAIGTLGGLIGEGIPIQLDGDSLYIVRNNTFAGGIGLDLATYQGLVSLRGEIAQGGEGSPFVGVGAFVNIPKLLNLIPGMSWQAGAINPSIGVVPGFDFTQERFDWAIVLSIISIAF
jgi:hypothetical protein